MVPKLTTDLQSIYRAVAEMMGTRHPHARIYNVVEATLVSMGLAALLMSTVGTLSGDVRQYCLEIVAAITVCAVGDWVVRSLLPVRGHRNGRVIVRALRGRASMIGLLSFVPIVVAAPFGWNTEGAPLFAVLWILRFARYSKGMDMLLAVLSRERGAVMGVLYLFLSVLMLCAVMAYYVEHRAQPVQFGSIPAAIWWTITTLTTTGYGDVVPITVAGRILAGIMMIIGLVVFGLLAGILATGFSQEVRRQEFLRNWDLVKQVPIFRDVGPAAIADLAGLLRSREIPARTTLCRRGEPGNAMYFIVFGAVEVLVEPRRMLGPGDFFGEMALLHDKARSATVVTTKDTQVLVLDVADFHALGASRPDLIHSIAVEAQRRLFENMSAQHRSA